MPTLSQSIKADVSKYVPAERPLPAILNANIEVRRSSMRSPLPPFNFTPDTLSQFENGGKTPQVRLIPLPVSPIQQTTVTNTTVASSSSSSSSSSVTTTLTAKTANYSPGSVGPSAFNLGSIAMAKSFQLLQLSSDSACDIRIYGSAVGQALDAVRVTDQPVAAETVQDLISNIVFDTSPYTWPFQNRIGANSDATQSTTIYITVYNPDPVNTVSPNITITYLPLES